MARDWTGDNSADEILPDSPNPGPFHDSYSTKTVMVWFKVGSSNNGAQCLWEIGGATNGMQLKYQIVPDTIKFTTAQGGTAVSVTSSTTYTNDGDWHCAVCVYDGGSMELFIDGTSEATGSNGTSIGASTDEPALGNVDGGDADTGATVNWEGHLAEFAMWGVALSDAEAQALANGTPPNLIRMQDLECYLPMKKWTSNLGSEPNWSGVDGNANVSGPTISDDHPPVGWAAPMPEYQLLPISSSTQTKTFTIDTILKATDQTKTFTIDTILQDTFTKTFTMDTVLQQEQTKTFTIDTVLKAEGQTKTFTIDTHLSATGSATKTFTMDTILQDSFTKTFTIDAILQQEQTKTFTIDAHLVNQQTKTFTIDAILKSETQTKTFTIDTVLQSQDGDIEDTPSGFGQPSSEPVTLKYGVKIKMVGRLRARNEIPIHIRGKIRLREMVRVAILSKLAARHGEKVRTKSGLRAKEAVSIKAKSKLKYKELESFRATGSRDFNNMILALFLLSQLDD